MVAAAATGTGTTTIVVVPLRGRRLRAAQAVGATWLPVPEWQASSLLGRGSSTARERRDVFVKSDPSESVGRRPRYFVSGGHTWSPHQLSATGKTAMSVTRLVLKRGSAAVTASNISDEKRLSMWLFLILL